MSIIDLSRVANISYGAAWALYRDKTDGITFDILARVCQALEVNVGDLFELSPDGNGSESGDTP